MSDRKNIGIRLVAFTRVTSRVVVNVPVDIKPEELEWLEGELASEIGSDDYQQDEEYWDQGVTAVCNLGDETPGFRLEDRHNGILRLVRLPAEDAEPEDPDICPEHPSGVHEPDWKSVSLTDDGDETYLDVNCVNCGRSGCIDRVKYLDENITW